jgi:hypothetical protein
MIRRMDASLWKNPIVLIVGVPFLFLFCVMVIGWLPQQFVQPKYDFLFVEPDGYWGASAVGNYGVTDGVLRAQIDPDHLPTPSAKNDDGSMSQLENAVRSSRLYVFDVKRWIAHPVSFAEAQQMRYDSSPISPDGYSVEGRRTTSGVFPFFFFDERDAGFVMYKGLGSRSLPLPNASSYGGSGFIGWIIK